MGLLGSAALGLGGEKLGETLGLGSVGKTILSGIGGFLGDLLPFKSGGIIPHGYRKVVDPKTGKVYLVAQRAKSKPKKKKQRKHK